MTDNAILVCEGLGASYGTHEVFQALDCRLGPGLHALRGANGIGKSTLLRLLAGAQPAKAGRVWIDGIDLRQAPEDAKRRLSYVPDESPIYPFMTGEELLLFVGAAKRTRIDAVVDRMIEAFDLARHLRTRFDAMSLGTRKKMMLCAAWIGAPRVMLLDEPSDGLDRAARDYLSQLFTHWRDERAILFSAHDEAFVTSCGADEIDMESLLTSGRLAHSDR